MQTSKVIRGLVIALVVTLAGYHAFAVTMAALPDNRYSTAVEPGTQYLNPFFTQNWRLFAPNPVSSDRNIHFQAEYEVDGRTETTDWVDLTDVELTMVRHRVIGGRAGYITNKFYSPLLSNSRNLSERQRVLLDGDGAMSYGTWAELRAALMEISPEGGTDPAVNRWIRYERAAAQLATQVLSAAYPDVEITAVRYRLVSVSVAPFEERRCSGEECEDHQRRGVSEFGWRLPDAGSERSQRIIAEFWERRT